MDFLNKNRKKKKKIGGRVKIARPKLKYIESPHENKQFWASFYL